MRILITGAKGMLGRTLCRKLGKHELLPTDLEEMDILKVEEVEKTFQTFGPEVVIHAAAMTDVDGCESKSDLAMQINAIGSGNVASACQRHKARMIAISTDYVFDGKLDRPYTEFDAPGPVTAYGKSKWQGEKLVRDLCPDHLILRIAWLYGQGGPSFLHTMIRLLSAQGDPLKVVDDQMGNPTSTDTVAEAILDYLTVPVSGTLHCTCEGEASWYQFTAEIKKLIGSGREVIPCSSEEYPRPAKRPANSRLENRVRKLQGFKEMPHWRESLEAFIQELKND